MELIKLDFVALEVRIILRSEHVQHNFNFISQFISLVLTFIFQA